LAQVVDEEEVANLPSVAVDGDRLAGDRGDGEPGDPALVLDAELAPAVDAGLSEDDGPQAIDAGVIPHVLVGGALAAAVGGVEVERFGLGDAARTVAKGVPAVALLHAHVLEPAVDLVGRSVEERRGGRVTPGGLEQVEGPERIHLEVVPWLG